MTLAQEPLAKSDGTTLAAHTDHVVAATLALAPHMLSSCTPETLKTAAHGAVLHDLGKAHPTFQNKLYQTSRYVIDLFEAPHRHEISSILFLELFDKSEWPALVEMVIAHHKSARRLPAGRKGKGIVDLVNCYGGEVEVFNTHFEGWERWAPRVRPILEAAGVTWKEITHKTALDSFMYALELCEDAPTGRSQWRGLLTAADHLASALQEETDARVDRLFMPPRLGYFENRAFISDKDLYPLAVKDASSEKPHTMVVAPTGAGKTDFLIRRCMGGRIFYVLPFQASINAMYLRLEEAINPADGLGDEIASRTDIRRIHGASTVDFEEGDFEEQLLQKHPGAAIKVMTPHQLAAPIFGLAGHEAVAADLAGQHVILDEVHVYSGALQAMVFELVKYLAALGCKVHIGSATMPAVLTSAIIEALGGADCVSEVTLSAEELRSYDRHTLVRLCDEKAARTYVASCLEAGKRVLLVANKVSDAQERYLWAKEQCPGIPLLLLHSRFRRKDRAALEAKISEFDAAPGPCLVISTQVVEVSLDISFDAIVTNCAPLDALIQRFGRVNRRRRPASERKIVEVGVIAPSGGVNDAKPYDINIVQKTWELLPDGGPLKEDRYQQLIDALYPELMVAEISAHMRVNGSESTLPRLCNVGKSVLFESLEIESACVITSADEDAYVDGDSNIRLLLEIPAPIRAVKSKRKEWQQLDFGSRPLVCPDDNYQPELGLTFA